MGGAVNGGVQTPPGYWKLSVSKDESAQSQGQAPLVPQPLTAQVRRKLEDGWGHTPPQKLCQVSVKHHK